MLSDVSFIFKNSFPGLPIKLPQILCDLIHYEKKNLNNFWIKLKKQNTLLSLFIIKNKNFLKSPTTSVNGRMAKYVDYDPWTEGWQNMLIIICERKEGKICWLLSVNGRMTKYVDYYLWTEGWQNMLIIIRERKDGKIWW